MNLMNPFQYYITDITIIFHYKKFELYTQKFTYGIYLSITYSLFCH